MNDKYNIDLSGTYDNDIFWQMSFSERASAIYLLEKMKNKNIAIEIGTLNGGFTKVLNNYFRHIYSLDIDHSNVVDKDLYSNITWIQGDSKETLSQLVDKINNSKEIVNFVLIDADHEYDGVYSDVSNILKIKPKDDLILLIHDSWYINSRRAICDINWNDNPYIHLVDTDFVAGDLGYINGNYQYIGGFCLVIISPNIRKGDIKIKQPHDLMYRVVNNSLGNTI
jgi:hypothetical protein